MSASSNSRPSSSPQRLEGKVAVVTGGASGIGESISRLFRKHGAKICVLDLQDGPGHHLCKSLGGDPVACFFHCDVTAEDDVRRVIDLIVEKHGGIDVMVNNAGITGEIVPDIRKQDLGEFKKVFDVNVHGVLLGMKHAARVMVPQKKGAIVSVASDASVVGGMGPHGYTGSKHAVLGLTRSVAPELVQHGIRVNCVSPYAVPSGLTLPRFPGVTRKVVLKGFLSYIGSHANLKGVNLLADDVADAVLYLASDEAKYVNGFNLMVDGGFTCVNNTFPVFKSGSLASRFLPW
ncbi:zerumbone synthase-like [Phoenix dactylifera]|uniref:Zerumbone synthase-like n=1 Tax=Phoenix dactylifera TaxID=42345 RepID=A0A8B9A9N2_PHODC|nr:zerumbone synthase-like [Phoenix dactylifera]